MNHLVIIGNGFDLAHGFNTRYTDFLYWYLASITNRLQSGSQEVNDDNLCYATRKYQTERIDPEKYSLDGLYEKMKEKNVFNLRPKGFFERLMRRHMQNGESKWVDVECEYFLALCSVFNLLKKNTSSSSPTLGFNNLAFLNNALSEIKGLLINYLNEQSQKEVSVNSSIEEHLEKILSRAKVIKNRNGLVSQPKVVFLNFNYTDTISLYLKKYPKEEYEYSVINIHGTIKNKDSIIFGYGDLMDDQYRDLENFNNNDLLKNIKQFYYLESSGYHDLIDFIEESAKSPFAKTKKEQLYVYIMGHSCGLSDRVLLNRIFDPSLCKKIYIYYHRYESGDDFFEKTQNISRHFDIKDKKMFIEKIAKKGDCSPL